MTSPPSPSPDRVLLVEGPDEIHVIRHLCDRHQLTSTFSILNKEGITNLLPSINPEIKAPGRRAIGIVADANDDLNARWNAVIDRLRGANIQAPRRPEPTGTIMDGSPRVGIWLMPDNTASSELENFVTRMIPAGDQVWPLSRRYIDDIPEAERKFSESKTQRAELYAWLAAREDPRRMGSAIGARDLDITGLLCQNLLPGLRHCSISP